MAFATGSVFAAVDAGPAQAAGTDADRRDQAGNAAGTIPAWEAGITCPPEPRPGQVPPRSFAADKPLFSITQANYKEHADQLTEGQKSMFAKYATFRMDVYPTRRSASFPKRTYEYTIKNATTARLSEDLNGVLDAAEGIPFPIPQNGSEIIWNHKMKYKGISAARWTNLAPVTAAGQFNMVKIREEFMGLYYKPGNTIADINNVLLYFYQSVEAPARLAGQVLLVHESLNQAIQPRKAWVYNPGQRRVRLAPNAYDTPERPPTVCAPRHDRHVQRLAGPLRLQAVGKQEMHVPYNSYRLKSSGAKLSEIIKRNHINPTTCATSCTGSGWWTPRSSRASATSILAAPSTWTRTAGRSRCWTTTTPRAGVALLRHRRSTTTKCRCSGPRWKQPRLQSGRALATGVDNEDSPADFSFQSSLENFTPQALRTRGVR